MDHNANVTPVTRGRKEENLGRWGFRLQCSCQSVSWVDGHIRSQDCLSGESRVEE